MGQEDPLEKEMATHSSILAWEIPRTEELGGYSPGSHKEQDMSEGHTLNKVTPGSRKQQNQSLNLGLWVPEFVLLLARASYAPQGSVAELDAQVGTGRGWEPGWGGSEPAC